MAKHSLGRDDARLSDSKESPQVTLCITPTVERAFMRRGVFPELRREMAARVTYSGSAFYQVRVELARKILTDAEAQHGNLELPRGLRIAYGALARNTTIAIRSEIRRRLWEDPGRDEVIARRQAASACFEVGEQVLYFYGDYGHEAVVVGPYGTYSVADDNGSYIDDKDARIDYRCGYVIQLKGARLNGADTPFFVAAHRLTRNDCKPAHIRLATSQRADSGAEEGGHRFLRVWHEIRRS